MSCLATVFLLLPLTMGLGATEPRGTSYTLRNAEAVVQPSSADGRFQVRAEARIAADATSADGRLRVKSTAATCAPPGEAIFRNGFEPQ